MDEKGKNYQEWIKKAENDLMAAQAIWNYYDPPPRTRFVTILIKLQKKH